MATDLTPFVLEVVKTHLNPPDLHARTAALPGGELFITLFTSHPTEALRELARALESEFNELELTVSIAVRCPPRGLWGGLKARG
jgi:hypothetical protein